jgi:positive regulator of sigma E activity
MSALKKNHKFVTFKLQRQETQNVIKHKAFVKEVNGTTLTAIIENQSACASCHASGGCSMADVREKEVEIDHFIGQYMPGQEVSILLQESLGFKALFFGYLMPFILMLIILIALSALTGNELVAGILALAILVPYYIILYFMRGRLKKIFKFELEESL